MRYIFLLLFLMSGICTNAQKLSKHQTEIDSISNLVKKNNELNRAFLKVVDSNSAVKEEYNKGIIYSQKAIKRFRNAGKVMLVGCVGGIAAIAVSSGGVAVAGAYVLLGGLVSGEGFLISSISSGLKSKKHMLKAYELAGIDCPCLAKKKRKKH